MNKKKCGKWETNRRRIYFLTTISALILAFSMAVSEARDKVVIDVNKINDQGVRYNNSGDYSAAVDAFRRACELEPNQPVLKANLHIALKNYSIDLARQGKADEAIRACSEALKLFPRDVTVASNLAIFFHKRAVDSLNEVRISNEIEAARYSEENEQAFKEALKAIETAERVVEEFRLVRLSETVTKTHALVYLLQGRYYFLKDELEKSLASYEECLRINPQEVRAYLDRARIYYERQYYEDAITDLEEAAELASPQNEEIKRLIIRISKEAEASGRVLSTVGEYFEVEVLGGGTLQQRKVKNFLKDIRREYAQTIANPSGKIAVTVDTTRPLVRVGEWLGEPPEEIQPDQITIGAQGVALDSSDFQRALRFRYLLTLIVNVGDDRVPYWFLSGLAQVMVERAGNLSLSDDEFDQLSTAAENSLLLTVQQLNWTNMMGLRDSYTIRLANLESKSLMLYLVRSIQTRGIGQILGALRKGARFEDALMDVTRLTMDELEQEWRKSLGF